MCGPISPPKILAVGLCSRTVLLIAAAMPLLRASLLALVKPAGEGSTSVSAASTKRPLQKKTWRILAWGMLRVRELTLVVRHSVNRHTLGLARIQPVRNPAKLHARRPVQRVRVRAEEKRAPRLVRPELDGQLVQDREVRRLEFAQRIAETGS